MAKPTEPNIMRCPTCGEIGHRDTQCPVCMVPIVEGLGPKPTPNQRKGESDADHLRRTHEAVGIWEAERSKRLEDLIG